MSGGEAIDRAIQHGASKEDIIKVAKLGLLPGVSEQVPIEIMLERIPLPAMGKVLGYLGKVGGKMLAEGGQEGLQQGLQNIIEKYIYDPDQDITEGMLEAAAVGTAVGGIVAVGTTQVHRSHQPRSTPTLLSRRRWHPISTRLSRPRPRACSLASADAAVEPPGRCRPGWACAPPPAGGQGAVQVEARPGQDHPAAVSDTSRASGHDQSPRWSRLAQCRQTRRRRCRENPWRRQPLFP